MYPPSRGRRSGRKGSNAAGYDSLDYGNDMARESMQAPGVPQGMNKNKTDNLGGGGSRGNT